MSFKKTKKINENGYRTSIKFGHLSDQSAIFIEAKGENGHIIGQNLVVRPVDMDFEYFKDDIFLKIQKLTDKINEEFLNKIESNSCETIIGELMKEYEVMEIKDNKWKTID